jgi:hypothetical protein
MSKKKINDYTYPTNIDLRIEVYLRSQATAMGWQTLKDSIIKNMLKIEQQIETDESLLLVEPFDKTPQTIRLKKTQSKLD